MSKESEKCYNIYIQDFIFEIIIIKAVLILMFKVGSYVSYRSEGVCIISDIRKENFGTVGKDTLYYVLSPVGDAKSTFFVPVDNDTLVAMMRKILSADEVVELITQVSKRPDEWISDSKARGLYFKKVLGDGERDELVFLIHNIKKNIDAQTNLGKKPYVSDINTIDRAAKLLLGEFSMTMPISTTDEVIEFIEKIYSENR